MISTVTSGMLSLEEDLPFVEVKKIRLQIEKDVHMLRNRVRILQVEEQKALKKIYDTKMKTKQINDLKAFNDSKFTQQLLEKQQNHGYFQQHQSFTFNKKKQQQLDIKQKRTQLHDNNYYEAQGVR